MKTLKEWQCEYGFLSILDMSEASGISRVMLTSWSENENRQVALRNILDGALSARNKSPEFLYKKRLASLFNRDKSLGHMSKYHEIPGTNEKYLISRSGVVIGCGQNSFKRLKPIRDRRSSTYQLVVNGRAVFHRAEDLISATFGLNGSLNTSDLFLDERVSALSPLECAQNSFISGRG